MLEANLMRAWLTFVFVVLALTACVNNAPGDGKIKRTEPLPIIDMHLHAHSLSEYGGGGFVCTNDQPIELPGLDPREPITIERARRCPAPVHSPPSDAEVLSLSLAQLQEFNIWAVASGSSEIVSRWRAAAGGRIT